MAGMREQRPVVARKQHYPRVFHEWGISVTILIGQDGQVYFPVRQICEELGVDVNQQIRRISESPDCAPGVIEMSVPTAGGDQRSVCLRKKETAWWLIHVLDDARCKKHIRGHLQDIKQRLMAAADAVLFGDIATTAEEQRGLIAKASHASVIMACLCCGAAHRITTINGDVTVELEREQGA